MFGGGGFIQCLVQLMRTDFAWHCVYSVKTLTIAGGKYERQHEYRQGTLHGWWVRSILLNLINLAPSGK
jgi:hypothetical protein